MVLQQLRHSIKKEQRFLAKSIELFKSKILNAFEKLNGAKSLNLKLLKQQMDQFAAKRLCPAQTNQLVLNDIEQYRRNDWY